MRSGVDVIVQPELELDHWHGRADILLRVDAPSVLGDWSYEVVDTKLARETRAGTILQLCLYSQMVGAIQDRVPELMHVVSPGEDFPKTTCRVDDFMAFFRVMK